MKVLISPNKPRRSGLKPACLGWLDHSNERESFVLSRDPPPQVQLGGNCRGILCGCTWRHGVKLESVTLATPSPDVVIGVSRMNPDRA